jgi:hypothetical protein
VSSMTIPLNRLRARHRYGRKASFVCPSSMV